MPRNFVVNPGFESGLSGYTHTFGQYGGIQGFGGHTGSAFYAFTNGEFQTISQTITTAIGQDYSFSFWAGGGSGPGKALNYSIGSSGYIAAPLSASGYTQYAQSFTATSTSTTITFQIAVPSGGGVINLDDIALMGPNTAPVASDKLQSAQQREVKTGNFVTDATPDSDADNDTLTTTYISFQGSVTSVVAAGTVVNGHYGVLTVDPNGNYSYVATSEGLLAVGATVTENFTYTVDDGYGDQAQADLSIQVTGSSQGDLNNNTFLLTGPGTRATGSDGDDTYYVDSGTDKAIEARDGGYDKIITSVSYSLNSSHEIEEVRLSDEAAMTALDLNGNKFAQKLFGNAGDNTLNGGGGADVMSGFGGDDTYFVDRAGDKVIEMEGDGYDVVQTVASYTLAAGQEIEELRVASKTNMDALTLTGNGFDNKIVGNAGNNVLNGKGGADLLYGLSGQDTFVFDTALGSGNVDRIADFSAADDTIQLARSVFTALGASPLSTSAFKDVSVGGPVDGDDRIIYSSKLGTLSYDADGSGTEYEAIQFAVLDNKATLTFQNFSVL